MRRHVSGLYALACDFVASQSVQADSAFVLNHHSLNQDRDDLEERVAHKNAVDKTS